jgi:quercetin dioxygenase-like cupin family protein
VAQSPPRAAEARVAALADSLLQAPAPPSGVLTRVVTGTASAAGERFEMMVRIDSGKWIAPHVHNVEKRIRVVRGVLLLGHGETQDTASLERHETGKVVTMPANTAHFEGGEDTTILLLEAIGPFTTTFVPRR